MGPPETRPTAKSRWGPNPCYRDRESTQIDAQGLPKPLLLIRDLTTTV